MTVSKLRQFRRDHSLTLRDVAALSGLSAGTLCKVENGQRALHPLTWVKLARSLGVQVNELLEGVPEPVTP